MAQPSGVKAPAPVELVFDEYGCMTLNEAEIEKEDLDRLMTANARGGSRIVQMDPRDTLVVLELRYALNAAWKAGLTTEIDGLALVRGQSPPPAGALEIVIPFAGRLMMEGEELATTKALADRIAQKLRAEPGRRVQVTADIDARWGALKDVVRAVGNVAKQPVSVEIP